MVVDPVVISATGFVVNYSVILETVLFQPRLGDLGVLTQTTGEESDDMTFFVPAIDDFDHVGKDLSGRHPFGLLIGDVLTHGTVDVDKEILAPLWKGWAYRQSPLIGCLNQLYHGQASSNKSGLSNMKSTIASKKNAKDKANLRPNRL